MVVAASLIDSLSKIGAITGIVSFVGLGLMILLVAGQSRQIRAMREWIDAEPERQAETAQRVIAEVQRRIAAARERRAAQVAQPPAAAPTPPRQVPPAPGTLGATPEARAVAAAKAGDTISSPTDQPAAGSVPPPTPGENGDGPVFAPLTPAADADADAPAPTDGGEPPILDALGQPIITSEPGQETQPADALPPEYDPIAAATPAAQDADPRFVDDDQWVVHDEYHEDERERSGGNRVLFGVGAAALLAGIVIAATTLFGGGSSDQPAAGNGSGGAQTDAGGGSNASDNADPSTPDPVDPSAVRVMVLNGTQVTGLAQKVTDRLAGQGYGTSQPNTFSSDQTRVTTTVEYRDGKSREARQVAKDLGLDASAAQQIESDVSAAAPETADVIVVTGQDLQSLAASDGGTTG